MKRLQIAQYIAIGASVISVIGGLLAHNSIDFGYYVLFAGMFAGFASYLFGGLLTALKMAGRIAKWGFIIAPIPYSLVTGVTSFLVAAMVLVWLPIIPIRKAYKESLL